MDKYNGTLIKQDNPSIVYKAYLEKVSGRSDGKMAGFIIEKDDPVKKRVVVFPDNNTDDSKLSGTMIKNGCSNKEYIRGMMAAKALTYDALVEYLQSTQGGEQYIILGEYDIDVKVVIDAKGDFETGLTQVAVGIGSANGYYLGGATISKRNKWGIGISKGMYINDPTFLKRVVSEISFGKSEQEGIIDGQGVYSNTSLKGTVWYAFGLQKSCYFIGKIYSIKFYDNNEAIIADLIPVRVGQVGYLYDLVSGQLFGNQSSEDFELGPDV